MGVHLFTTPDYGLCNRLRGYVGAWAYAKKMGCVLHVLWTESPACPYRIEELFEPLPNTKFITESESKETTYTYTTNDLGHLSHILAKYGMPHTLAPVLIASLVPVLSIRQKLQRLFADIPLSSAIGLHIRRTDHVDYANTLGGSTQMDMYWRAADAYPMNPIYLACDDSDTLRIGKRKYGARIHIGKEFSPSPSSSVRNTDGEHAVLDIYCLALCGQFQGSRLSSFSAHVDYLRQAWSMSSSLQKKIFDIGGAETIKKEHERIVFSFSLYGAQKKYTEGMIRNAKMITARFPAARIQIYLADDVPADVRTTLESFASVRIVSVRRSSGIQNMFDRFTAIDDTDCDVMFSRDADSRVNERDASCIEDFLASDKSLHILRDHRNHTQRIMGGMWGIRKNILRQSIRSMIQAWLVQNNNPSHYGCDQQFLGNVLYPMFVHKALVHDPHGHYRQVEHTYTHVLPASTDVHFIGQTYDCNESGDEVAVYTI